VSIHSALEAKAIEIVDLPNFMVMFHGFLMFFVSLPGPGQFQPSLTSHPVG